MEENQSTKFKCKFCDRIYPCGKSLGGHIRIHTTHKLSHRRRHEEDEDREEEFKFKAKMMKLQSFTTNGKKSIRRYADSVALESSSVDANSGYVFRDNPRRTRRFVDSSNFPHEKAKNGFLQSSKAQSEKDEEEMNKLEHYNASSSLTNGFSSDLNIEDELKEVALCLIMLSRDSSGFKGAYLNLTESSDNNSEDLETKSISSIDTRMVKKAADFGAYHENFDSGYFKNGPKKNHNFNLSSNGVVRNGRMHIIPPSSSSSKYELRKRLNNGTSDKFLQDSYKKMTTPTTNPDDEYWLNTTHKTKIEKVFYDPSLSEAFSGKCTTTPDERFSGKTHGRKLVLKKSKRHKCAICMKVFRSGQALGGHKRSHFVGGSSTSPTNGKISMVMKKESSSSRFKSLIDLNAPAPIEEEEEEE